MQVSLSLCYYPSHTMEHTNPATHCHTGRHSLKPHRDLPKTLPMWSQALSHTNTNPVSHQKLHVGRNAQPHARTATCRLSHMYTDTRSHTN